MAFEIIKLTYLITYLLTWFCTTIRSNGSPVVLSVLSVCNVDVFWPNGWMDQDATWYEVGLGPGDIVLDGDPCSSLYGNGHSSPTFRPMSIVASGATYD